jgi:hypothetical protein
MPGRPRRRPAASRACQAPAAWRRARPSPIARRVRMARPYPHGPAVAHGARPYPWQAGPGRARCLAAHGPGPVASAPRARRSLRPGGRAACQARPRVSLDTSRVPGPAACTRARPGRVHAWQAGPGRARRQAGPAPGRAEAPRRHAGPGRAGVDPSPGSHRSSPTPRTRRAQCVQAPGQGKYLPRAAGIILRGPPAAPARRPSSLEARRAGPGHPPCHRGARPGSQAAEYIPREAGQRP